ncbi:hypothetical protein EDC94DRAFT_700008 [Helicostylum pulchrum]|nr:hypothetical protein EDC94DRAFT_700008 [Helicostylum pulchrum]
MTSYSNPMKRTRVSSHNANFVRQLLLEQTRPPTISSASPLANDTETTEGVDNYDYCADYINYSDEESLDSEGIFVDSSTASEMNDDELHTDIDQEEIRYKVKIPKFAFTNIERYSVMFEEVCDTYNISREGSRAMRHLINTMLADETLDSISSKLLSHEACTSLVKNVIPLPMTRSYDVCHNGCYLYSQEDDQLLSCPTCNSLRSSAKSTKMVSIADKVAEMMSSDEICTTCNLSNRYTSKNDFSSYLKPIVNELKTLSEKTIVIQTGTESPIIRCKVYALFVNGDGIECNRLMNFSGHTGTYGCRFCLTKGTQRTDGPPNTRRAGMYFADRTAPLRSKESLLLEDSSSTYNEQPYGIKKATIFGVLSTFSGSCFFGYDEMHGISNVSKLFFDLLSKRYNDGFKHHGNESAYPFQLSNKQFECLNLGMKSSRLFIPTGAFQGSFHPVNPLNVKGLYRSTDWILFFTKAVPVLVWEISEAEIEEIKSSLETWYRYIDSQIASKALSNSIYKSSMHHLLHIPHIIQQCSSLRNISVRSMEREIGNYKKKMRARVNADANAINVLERITRFKFLETTDMIDFSVLYNRNPERNKTGFVYHPATKIDNCKDYPQLWEPFSSPVLLPANYSGESTIEGLIRMDTFILALSAYKRRYLGINKGRPLVLSLDETITPTAKLWLDSHVLTSVLFKSNLPASSNKRGGEFIMFESNVKKRMNKRLQSIPHWYVGKLLFFFEFDLEITEPSRRHGSFYALVEVMKIHKTAPHSTTIPMVQPFLATEAKKYAILDAADIISVIGLIQKTDLKNNQIESSNWFYVISPSTAFHLDMSTNAGKISDL